MTQITAIEVITSLLNEGSESVKALACLPLYLADFPPTCSVSSLSLHKSAHHILSLTSWSDSVVCLQPTFVIVTLLLLLLLQLFPVCLSFLRYDQIPRTICSLLHDTFPVPTLSGLIIIQHPFIRPENFRRLSMQDMNTQDVENSLNIHHQSVVIMFDSACCQSPYTYMK